MDIAAIQDALKAWVREVTACPCRWENQTTGLEMGKLVGAQIVLTGPMNIEAVGEDYVARADAGAGLVQPTVWGHREFDVQVRAITRSQAGNKTAQFWLEKIRLALRRPSADTTFAEAEFAVLSMSKGVQFDAPFEERWESIASATLRITCVVSDAEDAPETTLTSVALTSKIEGADGAELPTPPNFAADIVTVE